MLSAILGTLLVPGAAHAYRTAGDLEQFADTERVRWATPVIAFKIRESGAPGLLLEDVVETVRVAASRWEEAECTNLQFRYDGVTFEPATSGDRINTIEWITTGWTERGFPSGAAGTTDIVYELGTSGSWEIVEADVYVNATEFNWTLSDSGESGARDVSSVVTHELGHVLGLLHPCEGDGGNDAPSCGPDYQTFTMYPEYLAGQETLESDDKAGVCFLYEGEPCEDDDCSEAPPVAQPECEDGACEAPVCEGRCAADGDPCAANTDCDGGLCDNGICNRPCTSSDQCAYGFVCGVGTDERRCEGDTRPFGDACESPNDCMGNVCVDSELSGRLCSRACGNGFAECPNDWTCSTVAQRAVCVPPVDEGCGCRVAGHDGNADRLLGAFAMALGAVMVVRRRTTGKMRTIELR